MDRDQRLARWARKQYGAFSGKQAVAVGYHRRTVARRVASGAWLPIVGDTFRTAATPVVPEQRTAAAWLGCGTPAAIGGASAAALLNLGFELPPEPRISVPWTRRPDPPGVRAVRTRRWNNVEIVTFGGLRITSPARTLLDLAPEAEEERLETALDLAHMRGSIDLPSFAGFLRDHASLPGASRLRELVCCRDPRRPMESPFETRLFRVLREARLPRPIPQYWIETRCGPRRVDFGYPKAKIYLETDGYLVHGSRSAFEDGADRGNLLAELGWKPRHVTWRMLDQRPDDVVWTIATALGLRPRSWR